MVDSAIERQLIFLEKYQDLVEGSASHFAPQIVFL